MEHSKLELVLEMLFYLASGIKHTKQEVMERFGITERTFYRYIETFRTAGFIVPRPTDGRYYIDKTSPYFREIDELLHFSKEEAYILQKAIHSIDNENLLKQNLINKLYALYDFDRVADTVVKAEYSEHIHHLMRAIKEKKKVRLIKYKSAHSAQLSDRLIEPFDFTTNYMATWAYEPASGRCKLFRNTRMAEVEVLKAPWEYEERHKSSPTDVFRYSTEQRLPVKLRLSVRASHLLREEYPLSEPYIHPEGNQDIFEAEVCSFEGVGRFVLGLPQDVEVLHSGEFKAFLNKKVKKY